MNKKAERALKRMRDFSARGSNCPICNKSFRHDCNHTVEQAKDNLFQKYIKAITDEKE